ncbi:hypothetical protein GsuE55_27500 [Geobacillus subterraneus]|uniref:Uncharacterized protein n=1 Tax=Geobacillus subterraneus TaxID=129338 RepID=A0A679FUJ4_9BACL|nr:hypothetical protein GsuE55_27500 [Geobacillus subterraneus]
MTPEKLARYHPFDLESLKELSRPLPDEETERGNVGAKTPGDMGGFVLISDAEIQGCIEYASPHCSKKYPAVAAKRTLGL